MSNLAKRTMMIASMVLMTAVFPFGNVFAAELTGPQSETTESVSEAAIKKNTAKKKKATIKINRKKISLKKNNTTKLKATKKNAPQKKVIWRSSKASVAKVDQNGKITAKGKGTAVITARVQGTNVKAACKVEVQNYKLMKMRTTGYCNCRSCAGQWAGQPTASGRMPKANHTIAVDPHLIKLGTKVQIGNTIYTAEDTGGAIKGHRIDVYYSSHSRATHHGVKYQTVKVFY